MTPPIPKGAAAVAGTKGATARKTTRTFLRTRCFTESKWMGLPFIPGSGLLLLPGCDRASKSSNNSAAFLVISGDTSSWITPCGCTSNQSGGLLRRGTYLKQLSGQGQVIYADAGGAVSGNSEYQRMKLEAILRGEIA